MTGVGAWDPRKDSSPSSVLTARLDDGRVYLDFSETAQCAEQEAWLGTGACDYVEYLRLAHNNSSITHSASWLAVKPCCLGLQ